MTFYFFCKRTKSYFIISIWREDNPCELCFLLIAVATTADAVVATALAAEDLLLLELLVLPPLNVATLFPLPS